MLGGAGEKSSWFVALVGSALVAAIAGGTFALTRSKGDPVGSVDLLPAPGDSAVLMTDAAGSGGDKLYFRLNEIVVDREPTTNGNSVAAATGASLPSERQVLAQLRGSSLTVDVVGADNSRQSVTCPVYSGISSGSGITRNTFSMKGVKLGCEVPLMSSMAGPYKVIPHVNWASDLSVRSARLEVRRGPG